MALKADLKVFPDLSHHAFQHPQDRHATDSFKKIPLLPQFTRFLAEKIAERYIRLKHIPGSIKISARQYPSLYKQYVRMAETLDVRKLPELYICTDTQINAYAMGMENYSIVICSGLIDMLSEDELLALIGHELGHVKCEHILYNSAANTIRNLDAAIIEQAIPIGLGQSASLGMQLALLDWSRKAKMSCDRAALLATQNLEGITGALSKLAGYAKSLNEALNLAEIKSQADQYQEIGEESLLEKMLELAVFVQEKHPFPTVRLKEIANWGLSEEYKNILKGQYKKVGEEPKLKLV